MFASSTRHLFLVGTVLFFWTGGRLLADEFQGALWKFQMDPKTPGAKNKTGTFRVEGMTLYQRASASDKHRSLVVGAKVPLRKHETQLRFSALVSQKGKVIARNAVATIEYHRFGEWSGRLVDGQGKHWSFKCSRIAE